MIYVCGGDSYDTDSNNIWVRQGLYLSNDISLSIFWWHFIFIPQTQRAQYRTQNNRSDFSKKWLYKGPEVKRDFNEGGGVQT